MNQVSILRTLLDNAARSTDQPSYKAAVLVWLCTGGSTLLATTRRAAGLTQTEMADRIGVKQPVLSWLENNSFGTASFSTVLNVLDVYSSLLESYDASRNHTRDGEIRNPSSSDDDSRSRS